MIPRETPAHKEIRIPKRKMPVLPQGFEKIELGYPKGALSQYRGPNNTHVREYPSEWRVHRDYGDPRTPGGLLVHAFVDAPEVGFSLLAAVAAGKETYDRTRSIGDALADAVTTGLSAFAGMWLTKEFISWLSELVSSNSKI